MKYDVIVIGAGAAGLMCAIESAKRNRKTLLIDKAEKVGKKILISGGGRCNFTNMYASPDDYLSKNPHFCKSALARYTQYDFIDLVEKHNIPYHEKTLGQLFCDGSAREIVAMLCDEYEKAEGTLKLDQSIKSLIKKDDHFEILVNEDLLTTNKLVIATGGLSIPKMGSTGFAYEVAKQFDIPIVETIPALVPFTLGPNDLEKLAPLSGTSFHAIVTYGKTSFNEAVLITHRGLSGPAILQISSYWKHGETISINLFPEQDPLEWLQSMKREKPRAEFKTLLSTIVSKKLSQCLCDWWEINMPLGKQDDKMLSALANKLSNWSIKPAGTEGYKTAEVTRGGIDTDEISSKTFETRKVPGLFFIGESLDVTGHLGGFNFQWAWASGYCCGQFT